MASRELTLGMQSQTRHGLCQGQVWGGTGGLVMFLGIYLTEEMYMEKVVFSKEWFSLKSGSTYKTLDRKKWGENKQGQ